MRLPVLLCHWHVPSSGVAHLEFSVLHVLAVAVALDARLSSVASPCGGGGVDKDVLHTHIALHLGCP